MPLADLEEDMFNETIMDSQRASVEKAASYELMTSPDLAFAYEHCFPGRFV